METDLQKVIAYFENYFDISIDSITLAETGVVMVMNEDPLYFVASFLKALKEGRTVALLSDDFDDDRKESIRGVLDSYEKSGYGKNDSEILILTGGSGGKLRFARHRWHTLMAAARAFGEHFGPLTAATVVTLPLYHVSGLMAVLRALVCQESIEWIDYRDLMEDSSPLPEGGSLSLVPTQLSRWLQSDPTGAGLKRLGCLLLGGAKLSEGLAVRARRLGLPVVPCYGMTETAAFVCALDSEAFSEGVEGYGSALSHAMISIEEGQVVIRGDSLCYGYWPEHYSFNRNAFLTGDSGYINEAGSLVIKGRLDRLINSGGEKIDPTRVERVFEPLFGEGQIYVLGVEDVEWGERVVAVYKGEIAADETLAAMMKAAGLQRHEYPKEWIPIDHFPRSPLGKILFGELKEKVEKKLKG